jgi:hypothetical protein
LIVVSNSDILKAGFDSIEGEEFVSLLQS